MKRSARWLCMLLVIFQLFTMFGCKNTEKEWQEQYDLGRRYMSEGNYEEAILAFTAAIEIDPRNPEGYLFLAKAYKRSGDPEKALEVLEWGYEETDDREIKEEIEELEEELEEMEEEAESDSESIEEPSEAPDSESLFQPEEEKEIIGNGGTALFDGENSFYWSYAGYEDAYVLIMEDRTGNKRELYTGTDTELYLSKDWLYFNDDGSNSIAEVNYKTGESSTICGGYELMGMDGRTGNLLVRDDSTYNFWIFRTVTGEYLPIESTNTQFLTCRDGMAYLSMSSDSSRNTAELWMIDMNTGEGRMISSATVDDHYDYGSNAYIVGIQFTDDAIYYGCGWIAGTGSFFQPGGKLVRVSLPDYTTEVLDILGDSINYDYGKFYIFEQNGEEYVLYTNSSGEYNSLMNLSTREVTQTDMVVGFLGVPAMGYDGTGSYWVYPEADGQIIQVLPGLDSEGYSYYENINYTGRYIFYEIDYQKENPDSIAWWDYYITYRTEYYVTDLQTGEVTLLWSADY